MVIVDPDDPELPGFEVGLPDVGVEEQAVSMTPTATKANRTTGSLGDRP